MNLQRDAVVVDAIAAVNAQAAIRRHPVEAGARAEVVFITMTAAGEKRQYQRIEFTRAADVLDIAVEFVTQAKIERQVRRDPPVILNEEREVVVIGIGND